MRSAAALNFLVLGLAAALVATGCSGGDDESQATTVPAATTVAPIAAEPLFGSLGGFVAAFVAIGQSGATQGAEPFLLTEAALTRGPIPSGGEGFVSTDVIPSGVIGGTLDDDGAVTAVFVFLDPLTASAAPAVISLLGSTIATPAQFDQAAFAEEYRTLALDAEFNAGKQSWTASSNASGHSLVTTIVEGASGGHNLIEVAIVPIADEATALAAVKPIRNEVFGLVAG
jgi:hypothetical protein